MSEKRDSDYREEKEDFGYEMEHSKNCNKTVHQKAKITLPISIEPYVIAGKIKTKCCGMPRVTIDPLGDCKDSCHYLITQEICIDIPLKFGAVTETRETFIECDLPVIDDNCCE